MSFNFRIMKSLMPWSWGDQYLKNFFDEEFFPRFEGMSMTFPRLDMEDKGKELLIIADVPGVDQKDVHIEAEEDHLIIQGKTEEKKEEKKKNFYRQERKSGGFYREVLLPCCVDPKKVSAKFTNGTVEITLPKTKVEKVKRVKVNLK